MVTSASVTPEKPEFTPEIVEKPAVPVETDTSAELPQGSIESAPICESLSKDEPPKDVVSETEGSDSTPKKSIKRRGTGWSWFRKI